MTVYVKSDMYNRADTFGRCMRTLWDEVGTTDDVLDCMEHIEKHGFRPTEMVAGMRLWQEMHRECMKASNTVYDPQSQRGFTLMGCLFRLGVYSGWELMVTGEELNLQWKTSESVETMYPGKIWQFKQNEEIQPYGVGVVKPGMWNREDQEPEKPAPKTKDPFKRTTMEEFRDKYQNRKRRKW